MSGRSPPGSGTDAVILGDFLKAIGQIHDRRFLKVLGLGVLLALALLSGAYAVVATLIGWAVPDTFTLPWIGEITWVESLLSWGSLVDRKSVVVGNEWAWWWS